MSRSKSAEFVTSRQKPEWAVKIRVLRGARTQVEFARLCSVSQVTVSRWESGIDQPTPSAYARLAMLAGESYRGYFRDLSGLPPPYPGGEKWFQRTEGLNVSPVPGFMRKREPIEEETRKIPFLRDAALAGTPMGTDQQFIAEFLTLPAHWFKNESELCAVTVSGSSMEPIINDQSIVIIDTLHKHPRDLVGSMVAVRHNDGVAVKWLRKDANVYLLMSQHASADDPVIVLRPKSDLSMIGRVVKWIGTPWPAEAHSE
ncbi:MAG TPA: LexA family transcriptional regulator [Terracidiphilus sp.]|nr:LexA family transcriptional regulator [Terracidiphilus sp.]